MLHIDTFHCAKCRGAFPIEQVVLHHGQVFCSNECDTAWSVEQGKPIFLKKEDDPNQLKLFTADELPAGRQ